MVHERIARRGILMGLLVVILGCLGVLSLLQGWHLNPTVYGEGPSYNRPCYGTAGYQDDGQAQQARRHERERDRRTEESRKD